MAKYKEQVEKLQQELAEAEAQLDTSRAECVKLNRELIETKKYQTVYEQGVEVGKQYSAMLSGMIDGGMSEKDAKELIKASLSCMRF